MSGIDSSPEGAPPGNPNVTSTAMSSRSPDLPARRRFLALFATSVAGSVLACGADDVGAAPAAVEATTASGPDADGLSWHDAAGWGVEGRGWPAGEMDRFYARLPARARGTVRPPVWDLSQDSAGLLVRFRTDADAIHVRYALHRDRLEMPHMPATGVSGIDLYGLDAENRWRWVAVFRPVSGGGRDPRLQDGRLVDGLDPGLRTYAAYLPLYNGVETLEFGFPEGSLVEPIAPRAEKPIVFYGTSITHGACASRPGLCHPAILGRRLDRPVVNLGFSGNGKMEPEVAALLAELDPAIYVIDCLPNMSAGEIRDRAEPLVRRIREARPDTPIVLVEDRTYSHAWIRESARTRHETSREALRSAFDRLVASGVTRLHYLPGADLLGADGEATTDGSHPNDLGFMRQADAFEPVLRRALGR